MKTPPEKDKQRVKPKETQQECLPCKPVTSGNPLLDKAFQVFLKKNIIKK